MKEHRKRELFENVMLAIIYILFMTAIVSSFAWTVDAMGAPLFQLDSQDVTRTVTGSDEDDGLISGCVVQTSTNPTGEYDWVVQGLNADFTSCDPSTEACASVIVRLPNQDMKVGYQEGCTAETLEKRIDNTIRLTLNILNTVEPADITFFPGGSYASSSIVTREGGLVEQFVEAYIENTEGKKLSGRTLAMAIGNMDSTLQIHNWREFFPKDNVDFLADPWEKNVTPITRDVPNVIVLRATVNDYGRSDQFNDVMELGEFIEPNASQRVQALITLSGGSQTSPVDPDTDGDFWQDPLDNCTVVANTDQRDPDGDNYGAICDPDFNNDGITDGIDQGILQAGLFKTEGDPEYNPNIDMNGDGVTDSADVVIWRDYIGLPPGPSGRAP